MMEHKEFALRQAVALILDWRDYIPHNKRREYIKLEALYCRDEENKFNKCDKEDTKVLEETRTQVLEKRAEFLKVFREIMDNGEE